MFYFEPQNLSHRKSLPERKSQWKKMGVYFALTCFLRKAREHRNPFLWSAYMLGKKEALLLLPPDLINVFHLEWPEKISLSILLLGGTIICSFLTTAPVLLQLILDYHTPFFATHFKFVTSIFQLSFQS